MELSLRFDNDRTDEFELVLLNFLKKTLVGVEYLCTFEISENKEKPHYHVWLKTELGMRSVRNKFDYKFKTSHPGSKRALAVAKDPENLKSYIMKDGIVILTTLTDSQISLIPEWVSKKIYSSKDDLVFKIIDYMDELKVKFINKDRLYKIGKYVILYYRQHGKKFNQHSMKNLIWTIDYELTARMPGVDIENDEGCMNVYVMWILGK